jgi:putative Mg2+ transporter-C (MgtC) family protein
MTTLEFCLRIGTALLAGIIIGLERQLSRKTTGLRTNTLVALGATLYVLLSLT